MDLLQSIIKTCIYLLLKCLKLLAPPPCMANIFANNHNLKTDNVSANTRSQSTFYNPVNPKTVHNGLETLRCLGPKIWKIIHDDIKATASVSLFKRKIRNWTSVNCPCRHCKNFLPNLGNCILTLYFNHIVILPWYVFRVFFSLFILSLNFNRSK